MTRLTRPASSYQEANRIQGATAAAAAHRLAEEFRQYDEDLRDHGYSVVAEGGMVAVKRGALDIVRVVFDYAQTGRNRVVNGVREALNQAPAYAEYNTEQSAFEAARKLFVTATDEYYANKNRFQNLGIG